MTLLSAPVGVPLTLGPSPDDDEALVSVGLCPGDEARVVGAAPLGGPLLVELPTLGVRVAIARGRAARDRRPAALRGMSLTVALAGQPNCGKSSLFNALVGFRANTGNFAGTSVSYTTGAATVDGERVELVDLPGLYALRAQDAAEQVAEAYLRGGRADALVVVLDATLLARGLVLAQELLALGLPAVVAVNMMDEARRRGLEVDLAALERGLGVPVVATVATRKEGATLLLRRLHDVVRARSVAPAPSQRTPAALQEAARALAAAAVRPAAAPPPPSRREQLDRWLLHPLAGPVLAVVAFSSLFVTAFFAGDALASLVAKPFDAVAKLLEPRAADGAWWALAKGAWDGLSGGAGIVLPYLFPLVLLLSLYEDIGYLPRAAYLVDGLFSRLGLHGKSVVPLVLGYGCNVPALVGTRILESPRERLVTALLVPLVPCSARTVVVLALVAATLGPLAALALYALNLVVVAVAGRVLSGAVRGRGKAPSLGILMEMPPLRLPPPRAVLRKVWFRSFEFLTVAWPILLGASVVLALLEFAGAAAHINALFEPLTVHLLGLPAVVGVTLFFGVLRKELSLAMLAAALGTDKFATVLSTEQLVVFTVFVMFYVPCVSTIATMAKELGARWAAASAVFQTALALVLAGGARLALG